MYKLKIMIYKFKGSECKIAEGWEVQIKRTVAEVMYKWEGGDILIQDDGMYKCRRQDVQVGGR